MTIDPGPLDVVTGAFSYSGHAIARQLRARGRGVRTLTGNSDNIPVGSGIDVRPLDFDNLAELTRSMRGAHTLYNTYWVRFAHGGVDHDIAVTNSQALFRAAAAAGIQRIVHVSITHPASDSPYPYFRGKARVEGLLAETGVSHAIVRPAILFGHGGVLINNVAWLLRHLPIFAIGGDGAYRIRGIHVDDLARVCVGLGAGTDPVTVDAVGPQSLTFRELVEAIRTAVGSHAALVSVPAPVLTALSRALTPIVRDTVLTADEYHAMADGLADSDAATTGTVAITDWIADNSTTLGRRYANELNRHFRTTASKANARSSLPLDRRAS